MSLRNWKLYSPKKKNDKKRKWYTVADSCVTFIDIASHVNDVARGALANLCSENLVIFRVGKWHANIIFLYDQYTNCIFWQKLDKPIYYSSIQPAQTVWYKVNDISYDTFDLNEYF